MVIKMICDNPAFRPVDHHIQRFSIPLGGGGGGAEAAA